MTTRLILTRHPETEGNLYEIIQGHTPGKLTQKGYAQMEQFSQRLSGQPIDAILSSDIYRCKLFADYVGDKLGTQVTYWDLLREKNDGILTGRRLPDIDWAKEYGDFEQGKAQGGESLVEVRQRSRAFFQQATEQYRDKTVLVVSHGAFLKVFFGDLLGMSLRDSIFKLHIDHCSVSVVDTKTKEDYKVSQLNNMLF